MKEGIENFLNSAVATKTPVEITLDPVQFYYSSNLWNWYDPKQPGFNENNVNNDGKCYHLNYISKIDENRKFRNFNSGIGGWDLLSIYYEIFEKMITHSLFIVSTYFEIPSLRIKGKIRHISICF